MATDTTPATTTPAGRAVKSLHDADTDPHVVALVERLLTAHPDLPHIDLISVPWPDPEPGGPAATLWVRLADGDTDALAAWAAACGTTVHINGAKHHLETIVDQVRVYAGAYVPEETYGTPLSPLALEDFGTRLHGVAITEVGDDGGLLVAFGHVPKRRFLAAVSAWPRTLHGVRYVPHSPRPGDDPALAVQYGWARGEDYPSRDDGRLDFCDQDAEKATPVTFVHVETAGIRMEDPARLERCPACGRASRSTTECWLTGRHDYIGDLHTCRGCGHHWPAVDTDREPRFHDTSTIPVCRICGCTDDHACPGGCTWTPNPLLVDVCSACYSSLPARTWTELALAGYGAGDSTPGRDSWLFIEARRSVPVQGAAQAWEDRTPQHRA